MPTSLRPSGLLQATNDNNNNKNNVGCNGTITSLGNTTISSPTEEARLNNATPAPQQPRLPASLALRNMSPNALNNLNNVNNNNGGKRPNDTLARQQQALECDYDVSPTDLYQAIEAKQWDYVHRLFQIPNGATTSLAKPQAATWVVRKEHNGKLRWRLLPIHAAIIFQAPTDIIELLLSEYPEGASCKDDQGMLPLHLAMRNTPSNFCIIEELLTVHPAAVYVKDRKGRTPLQGGMAALKDPSTRSALNVMDLYTHIATAGEKQRWLAEQRQAADQRLAATQEQHIQRLTALKTEFEKEYQELESAHIRDKMDLQNQLEIAQDREQRLRKQIAELLGKLEGSHYESMQHREFELKEQNQELRLLLQKLLDQQASLALSLEKLTWGQKELQDKRTNLMQQCVLLDEELALNGTKHATAWKAALDEVHSDITQKVAQLFVGGIIVNNDETQQRPGEESTITMSDEKKEDNDSDFHPDGITTIDTRHLQQQEQQYEPSYRNNHSDSENSGKVKQKRKNRKSKKRSSRHTFVEDNTMNNSSSESTDNEIVESKICLARDANAALGNFCGMNMPIGPSTVVTMHASVDP